MSADGGSISPREPNDDEIRAKLSPGVHSLDGEYWFEGDLAMPRPPFTYWLKPRNWPGEASCWLAQHNWTKYCHVHDVIHWGWTHRNCCNDQRRRGLAALRKAGLHVTCGWWVGPIWKLCGETCVCTLAAPHPMPHVCNCGAWFEGCGHPPATGDGR